MAPEQGRGEVVGTRADLFSLGCVLYHMAVGQPPFRAPDSVSLLVAVATVQPAPPRAVNPAVPPALSDLILRLLAKKPEDRPPSARAVADALQTLEQTDLAPVRRQPSRRLLVAAAVAAVPVVGCLLLLPAVLRHGNEQGALTHRPDDSSKAAAPESPGVVRLVELRRFPGHNESVETVAFSPDGKQVLSGGADGKALLWDINGGPPLREFTHGEVVHWVAFLPDGHRAVTGGGDVRRNGGDVEGRDFAVRLWDLDTGKEVRRFEGHKRRVTGLAVSSDGHRLLTGSIDGTVRFWDVDTGQQLRISQHDSGVWCVDLTPDGRWALSGAGDGKVQLWDPQADRIRHLRRQKTDVLGVAFAPDGKHALTGAVGSMMRLYDLDSGEPVKEYPHPTGVDSVAFSPNGRRAVSTSGYHQDKGGVYPADEDYRVRLWDVATGWELARTEEYPEVPTVAVFSPDGHYILCGGDAMHLLEIQDAPAAPAGKP
jgi:hypothetical protein